MDVGGFVLPDAELRSLVHRESVTCDPFARRWLDRSLMSADRDRKLHREGKCPFVELAAGRWQIATRDPDYGLKVAAFDALDRPVQATLHKAAERRAALAPEVVQEIARQPEAVVRPGGDPWDAYDGDWVLLLRNWVAVLSVTGQCKQEGSVPTGGLSTWSEHRSPARPYPLPTGIDHARVVARYLGLGDTPNKERWRSTGLPLAHYFAELIMKIPGGRPKEIRQVAIDLCLDSPRRVETICSTVYPKIWPMTDQADKRKAYAQLFRYLMDNNMLRREDVLEASAIAEENRRSGASARAAELFDRPKRR